MIRLSRRSFSYIPISKVIKALESSYISISDSEEMLKANLCDYYNSKLLYHLKYQQWVDFFYLYKSSLTLSHGANTATYIIAAHGYVMAYQNTSKAFAILQDLPECPAIKLSKNFISCYEELNKIGLAPNTPDWVVCVNLCVGVTLKKKNYNKWQKLASNERTEWHKKLRPWKYPRHDFEVEEELRFKQRGEK